MLLTKHGKVEQAEALMRDELEELYLYNCKLGDDEAVIVAAFLKVDDIVEELDLGFNRIEPRGAKAIANALKYNKTVWYLDLGNNLIGDQGVDSLINALSHNVCIIELYVNDDYIYPKTEATIEYLTKTRNKVLIPATVRQASLYLIAARRATPIADSGALAIFPKEIVRMIAIEVWATRKDPIWIQALSESEQTGVM